MVLMKMSSNGVPPISQHKTEDKAKQRFVRPQPLPPTTFENPILLSSSTSSSDEEDEDKTHFPPPVPKDVPVTSTLASNTMTNHTKGFNGHSKRPEKLNLDRELSTSDICVSGTSDSTYSSEDENVLCQPLSELRNLITRKNRRVVNQPSATECSIPDDDNDTLVDITDYTHSDDYSSDSSSDPLFKPPSSLVRQTPILKHDLSQSLIVQIPLHLVTIHNHHTTSTAHNNQSNNIQKLKRSFPLSHFATIKKRAVNDVNFLATDDTLTRLSSLSTLKPPISLKLTKSPTGSSWLSATPINSPSPIKQNVTCISNSNSSSSSNKRKKTSPTKLKTINEHLSIDQLTKTSITTTKTDTEHAVLSSSKLTAEDDVLSLASNSSLTTSSSVTTTATTTTTNGHSNNKPNKTKGKVNHSNKPKRRYSRTPKPITNVKNVKSTICFEKQFGHLSPQLVFHKGELQPLHSLSLKNVNDIPADHPIHSWTLGKPVPKSRNTTRKPSPHPLGSY